jgi:hypothetical protein
MIRILMILAFLLAAPQAFAQSQCASNKLTYTPFSQGSATTATLIAGVAGKKIYICKGFLWSPTGNVALVEGTGTNCSTVSAGLLGGTTAAAGQVFSTNSGFVLPADALPWAVTATAGDNVCLITSGSGPASGILVSAQQ